MTFHFLPPASWQQESEPLNHPFNQKLCTHRPRLSPWISPHPPHAAAVTSELFSTRPGGRRLHRVESVARRVASLMQHSFPFFNTLSCWILFEMSQIKKKKDANGAEMVFQRDLLTKDITYTVQNKTGEVWYRTNLIMWRLGLKYITKSTCQE